MTPPSSTFAPITNTINSAGTKLLYPNNNLLSELDNNNFSLDENNYTKIYNFILKQIITQYDELNSCSISYTDEEGYPATEFYIKYKGDLTYKERKLLNYKILKEIYEFCSRSNIIEIFDEISVFLIRLR